MATPSEKAPVKPVNLDAVARDVRAVMAGKASIAAVGKALAPLDDKQLALVSFATRAPIERLRQMAAFSGQADLL